MASMNQKIIWIHGDCLNPNQKAIIDYPDCPAIWVWDDNLLRRRELSLKRITFIYECLLEIPVEIRRGDTVDEIVSFAVQNKAETVITMHSISPGFDRICAHLRKRGLKVITYEVEAFVALSSEPDLRRFSRYWRQVQKHLKPDLR